MAKPTAITDATFDSELESEVPVLVDFWATWCGPCRLIAPVLEELAEDYNGQLKIVKMDVDQNPSVPMSHGVQSIPTLILFKEGKPVERLIGYMPKERLISKLQPHLN